MLSTQLLYDLEQLVCDWLAAFFDVPCNSSYSHDVVQIPLVLFKTAL